MYYNDIDLGVVISSNPKAEGNVETSTRSLFGEKFGGRKLLAQAVCIKVPERNQGTIPCCKAVNKLLQIGLCPKNCVIGLLKRAFRYLKAIGIICLFRLEHGLLRPSLSSKMGLYCSR
jgi:hypothetical protein